MRRRLALAAGAAAVLMVATRLVVLPAGELYVVLMALSFAAVGCLLAVQRPANPIGWLFLVFGTSTAANFLIEGYAIEAIRRRGSLPGGDAAASVAAHSWHASFVFFVFACLLFPDGRLPSARWRWVARATVVVYAGLAVSGPFDGDFVSESIRGARPLVHGTLERVGTAVFGLFLTLNLLMLILAGASLAIRLRRAAGVERQQVKWFVTPVACVMIAFPASVIIAGDGRFGVWLFPLIPASAAVAILRYRLYDIDLVIRRTLVYAVLTATLVGAYLVTVLLAQLVLPARSDLAVALSTLAAAAVFAPARARIQAAVDRRFFRRRYDAERTLAAFGTRLRGELDLAALSDDLCGVVTDTIAPAHVSLWLKR